MKYFNKFVNQVVDKWRKIKSELLESEGLGDLANRTYGDKAEDYIRQKAANLGASYSAIKTKGSQTPADIIAIGRKNNCWHIMLIQVKSSNNSENIYQLNDNDIEELSIFANFFKKEFKKSEILEYYRDKPILISTGYAGVERKTKDTVRHSLIKTKVFKLFKMNSPNVTTALKKSIRKAHQLN